MKRITQRHHQKIFLINSTFPTPFPKMKNTFPKRSTTFRISPEPDLSFILQHKSTQTEVDQELEELLAIKNAYNELSLEYQKLDVKYERSKEKFQESKNLYHETKYNLEEMEYRATHLPLAYQRSFVETSARLVRAQSEIRDLKDKLMDIKAITNNL